MMAGICVSVLLRVELQVDPHCLSKELLGKIMTAMGETPLDSQDAVKNTWGQNARIIN